MLSDWLTKSHIPSATVNINQSERNQQQQQNQQSSVLYSVFLNPWYPGIAGMQNNARHNVFSVVGCVLYWYTRS